MKRTGLLALIFVCFAWQPPAKKFIDPANMDVSIKPGDNFYRYANGNWIKNNPVPPSEVRWGSFDNLFEETRKRLQTLLETAAAKAIEEAVIKVTREKVKSLAAGKMGYSTSQLGDMVAQQVAG